MLSPITIYNFLAISDRLYTAGQPEESELQQLLSLRIQTVINLGLADAEYALQDEATSLRQLGMTYRHIPVQWQSPQRDDVIAFIQAMKENAGRNILVHCAANKRVSIFLAIYRLLFLAEDRQAVDRSIAEIWEPNEIWKGFMEEMLLEKTLRNL